MILRVCLISLILTSSLYCPVALALWRRMFREPKVSWESQLISDFIVLKLQLFWREKEWFGSGEMCYNGRVWVIWMERTKIIFENLRGMSWISCGIEFVSGHLYGL